MNSVHLQDTRKIQKKIIFLHDSNKQFEDIIRKTFFIVSSKRTKCQGINQQNLLTKEV